MGGIGSILHGERAYLFKPACQFTTTVYGRGPLLGTDVRNRLPSAEESQKALVVNLVRECFPARNVGTVAISTVITPDGVW